MAEMIKKETEVEVMVTEVIGEGVEVEGHIGGDLMTVIGLVVQEVEAMEVLQEANQILAFSVNLKGTLLSLYITLFTKGMECYHGKLLSETVGCAVLDSGCIKNVCSQYWLVMYLDTPSDKDRSSVIYTDSNARFCFGDGSVYKSKYRVKFPAN